MGTFGRCAPESAHFRLFNIGLIIMINRSHHRAAKEEDMRALRTVNKILAIAIIVWGVAVPVYLIFFAQVSYASTTASATQAEAAAGTTVSGSQPWISAAEPVSIIILLAFSALLIGGGIAVWKSALAEMIILAMLALVGSYMTGFSIGGLYLPGAIALALATLLSVITVRLNRSCVGLGARRGNE